MVTLHEGKQFIINNDHIASAEEAAKLSEEAAKKETLTWQVLSKHNHSDNMEHLEIQFDSMGVYDNTYVGILQTAYASGLKEFPMPCVFTNCHNCLCAVGGTINTDVHKYAESACRKSGGIFVPPHEAVIHQYMREMIVNSGDMSIVSDSHTRYGTQGSVSIGEGGPELAKAMLGKYYEIDYPGVIAVLLTGTPKPWVGPMDVALSIIGKVFKNNFVKNKVLEFIGPGVHSLSMDFRNGIDTMTTESACLSSVWVTDDKVKEYFEIHKRPQGFKEMVPGNAALYDGVVEVNLDTIVPMIALPFHPSNAFEIDELKANMKDILHMVEKDAERVSGGKAHFTLLDKIAGNDLMVQQGIIAGCAGGTYTNVMEAAHALRGKNCGCDEFSLAVYPSSQPVFSDLVKKGAISDLMDAGAIIRTAFCGPCFGAGDTPCNNGLSIRHTTRNFPNREGSKPGNGQMAAVALMDARSIAATAANGGKLTSAWELDCWNDIPEYNFDDKSYKNRVYQGFGKAEEEKSLVYGPNIKDWPEMSPLTDNILLKVCSKIMDPVTTTDELIPSGETSSYRSNPLGLAEFTLSRRDPEYVGKSKAVDKLEKARTAGQKPSELDADLNGVFDAIHTISGQENVNEMETEIGSMIYAVKPGDGSAREQAASCQRVIGGLANITKEYATKRYRSNVMNWGMIPFQMVEEPEFEVGDYIYVPGAKAALDGDLKDIKAYVINADTKVVKEISLYVADMTADERKIVKAGCLINYNRARKGLK